MLFRYERHVRADLEVGLLIVDDLFLRLWISLDYWPTDPYVVRCTFPDGFEGPVAWSISRELLRRGLTCQAGDGDVAIGPTGEGNVILVLRSQEGAAVLRTRAAGLARFLDGVERLLPYEQEHVRQALDTGIAQILDN
ncbi:SsgA family sporulation/cell division regulator [Kitasatospora mediocidica]|uniref:SsgA family sporulation/cell division regulator n=1 Tax=Kitasatospora mediocidica TaxID=58352 RepID=UPI00068E08AF|nr:SsgA family sporulation/cell division regulator [Kitasatospora mediocidica]